MCKHVCQIPRDGVDGFKTDFHLVGMQSFIQQQIPCEDSSICELLDQFHEKLQAQCHEHVESLSETCCRTCGNIPVCKTCVTTGIHTDHELIDIIEILCLQREKLRYKLSVLEKRPADIYKLRTEIEGVLEEERKHSTVNLKKNLQRRHEADIREIENRKSINLKERIKKDEDIDAMEANEIRKLEAEEKREIQLIKLKYVKLRKEKLTPFEEKRKEIRLIYSQKEALLMNIIHNLEEELQRKQDAIDLRAIENGEELNRVSNHLFGYINKLEDMMETGNSLFGSNDAWEEARSLRDKDSSCDKLLREIEEKISEAEALCKFAIKD